MGEIEFGRCRFVHDDGDGKLYLHTRDLDGVERTHAFYLSDAFLHHLGGGIWRFVTGAGEGAEARHLFDDVGEGVDKRVDALRALGVPVLSREEGKQNLERHKLPVKRLVLAG